MCENDTFACEIHTHACRLSDVFLQRDAHFSEHIPECDSTQNVIFTRTSVNLHAQV
jgi:hypothetical protein